MKLLIIPDPHANPDYNNERFRAAGRLLMEEQPECVVCLGDLADGIKQYFGAHPT